MPALMDERPSIERLRAEIARFQTETRDGWSGPARVSRAEELVCALQALDSACTIAVKDANRDRAWTATAFRSITGWLAHTCAIARHTASGYARRAAFLDRFDLTAKAFDAGDISVAALDRLSRVAKKREKLFERDEQMLLDVATAPTTTLDDLDTVTEQWRLYADDQHTPAEAGDMPSYLDMHVGFGGYLHLKGALEPRLAAIVQAALDRAMGPPADDDDRPTPERRAEALADICGGVREDDEDKRPRINIDAIADLATMTSPDTFDPDHSFTDVSGIGPIRRSDVRALACDAHIGAILTRGRSQVVAVRRQTRIVPLWMRRALNARDRRCQHPGCITHYSRCDAHHIVHWADGGETELHNLILLCSAHHHHIHRERLHITRDPLGRIDLHHDPP